MAETLTLYTHPMSRGRTVRWMLEEVGAPYETVILEFGRTIRSPDYLAVNPMGKVPAIRHGETVVTEAAAICAYLADAFPEAGLAPDPAARGAYYRWLFFAAGPIEAAAVNRALGVDVPAEKRQMVGYGSMDAVVDTLEAAVAEAASEGGYLAGERFSAADVYVGASLGWMMQFDIFPRRPAFAAYWERIKDRPAAVRARAVDDGLIAEMKARAR
ncbi:MULTISPECIES: glutathione S-transferase family protein [unclassified Aureimonas]|uniref:glutathione S-transferase family protein n=1 Tax=unclassified Aureimonas TaxID=2615206 RepID=UPI0006F542D2|nr:MULTISPECIES: glutathione S-transferase family protein [unclassified Aureimonas]KQT64180.1 glutathione S-transferase [Aureimonas sp. Leaf427]KQT81369.1 glutathione S-transferase [Aureimonas sp. Leaf460]